MARIRMNRLATLMSAVKQRELPAAIFLSFQQGQLGANRELSWTGSRTVWNLATTVLGLAWEQPAGNGSQNRVPLARRDATLLGGRFLRRHPGHQVTIAGATPSGTLSFFCVAIGRSLSGRAHCRLLASLLAMQTRARCRVTFFGCN